LTIDGCLVQADDRYMLVAWVPGFVLGGTFFLLTLVKLHPYLRAGPVETPLLTAFVRDGAAFFDDIFCSELFSAIVPPIIIAVNRPALQGIYNPWLIGVYAIAAPRLVLHLRGVVSRPASTTAHTTTQTVASSNESGDIELAHRRAATEAERRK